MAMRVTFPQNRYLILFFALVVAIVAGITLFSLIGRGKKKGSFSIYCPDPVWLDQRAPTGSSHAELQSLFRQRLPGGMPRRDLSSVGFLSIKRNPENSPVVFYSLMLVAQGDDYPALETCANHLLGKYLSSPKQAAPNLLAGAVGQVSQALLKRGNPAGAATMLDLLFKNYSQQIPDYMSQAYGYFLAEALAKTGRKDRAIDVLQDLIDRFETREEVRLRPLLDDVKSGRYDVGKRGTSESEQARKQESKLILPQCDFVSESGTRLLGLSMSIINFLK